MELHKDTLTQELRRVATEVSQDADAQINESLRDALLRGLVADGDEWLSLEIQNRTFKMEVSAVAVICITKTCR